MNRKAIAALSIFMVLSLVFSLMLCSCALAQDFEASTMRLLRYQGDVVIYDPTGLPRFVLENVRFASGEAMQTGPGGQASVGLDDSKIVTLDASSRVEFVQESGHTQLKLTEGTIFLDVSEKLDENESLDIQTTTMTVGIRGTIVFMSVANETGRIPLTTLGVLEGTAQVDYTDTSGSHRLLPVPAGQQLIVQHPSKSQIGVSPIVSDMTSLDIEGFIVEQVLRDENLIQRVTEGSENGAELLAGTLTAEEIGDDFDFPADGDWSWSETITLVAQSASKLYDGRPLARPSDVLVYGLPNGLHIQVAANGSQTNAGSSVNPIAAYSIYNEKGEDVTSHFTNIETISGTLQVDPIPVTVWTGSADKYYDGEALTCDEAELKTAPGYVYGDPEWRNTSLVTRTALGSETMISAVGVTWVHGTNPITGDSQEIALFTGQRLSVCLHSKDGAESIEFLVENVPPEDLPEDILRLYADNPDLLSQACEDAGWDPKELEALIAALPTSSEQTVTRSGVQVSKSATGDLMTDSTNVRITIDTDITDYNSRPLNGNEAHFTPIELEPTIKIIATGSQTEIGESANTYTIDWGSALAGNYQIIGEELGTLTVLENHEGRVLLTAASVKKVYDGKPLIDHDVYMSGLPDGFTFTAKVEGSQTNAGESANRITEYAVFDESGEDVTEAFTNLKILSGKLTVEPAALTVTTGSAEKVYDGTALGIDNATVTGLVGGEKITVTCTGTITDVGTAQNTCTIDWGNVNSANYTVSKVLGTLQVAPAPLTIRTGSDSKVYDGSALTNEQVSTSGLQGSDTIFVTATGSVTLVGSVDNTFSIDWGTTLSENYTLVEETGTLTVKPNPVPVVFSADSAFRTFCGQALTAPEVTVSGLPGGGFSVAGAAGGSQTDAGSSANPVTEYMICDRDGNDVTDCFSGITTVDGTLEVAPCSIHIILGGTFIYDGNMHYANLSVSGLSEDQFAVSMNTDGSGQIAFAWGDVMRVQVNYGGTEEGFYGGGANPLTVSFVVGNASNYAYTVKANPVQITEGEGISPSG